MEGVKVGYGLKSKKWLKLIFASFLVEHPVQEFKHFI